MSNPVIEELSDAEKQKYQGILDDPVLFARHMLHRKLWSTQNDILRALNKPNAQVAVKACQGSGKTFVAACAALWFLIRYNDSKVLTTAPGQRQVKDLLWSEIATAVRESEKNLYPRCGIQQLRMSENNFAIGITTALQKSTGQQGARLRGYHAPHLLYIVDEASAVEEMIWEEIEGARSGGDVRMLLLANPTVPAGRFYNAFTRQRTMWDLFTIDAFDSPNLKGWKTPENIIRMRSDLPPDHPTFRAKGPEWQFLTSRRWVYETMINYGVESAFWKARVRGEFPEQADDSLLWLAWLERAIAVRDDASEFRMAAGIDVADGGDSETAVYVRQGPRIIDFAAWRKQDPRGEVVNFLEPYRDYLDEVNVDTAGIGSGMGYHLDDLDFPVNRVNVGEATDFKRRFVRLKDQLYWSLRENFQAGQVQGLVDELTRQQLASLRYDLTPRGLVEIESKERMRERGIASPDRAEALMLCFADRTNNVAAFYRDAVSAPALQKPATEFPVPFAAEETDDDDDVHAMTRQYERERARLEEARRRGQSNDDDGMYFKSDEFMCKKCGRRIDGPAAQREGKWFHQSCI